MTGWRVMVPVTAVTLLLIGAAEIVAAPRRGGSTGLIAARALALLAGVVPLLTFIEYVSDTRLGIESWFGVAFDPASATAGRMSPLTSVCLISLAIAVAASTDVRTRWLARVTAGAALLTAWLALLTIALDVERLADAPRFPGMALPTIGAIVVASWGAVIRTIDDPGFFRAAGVRSFREASALTLVFIVPLLLGWLRDVADPAMPQAVVTALLVMLVTSSLAAMVWHYALRLDAFRRDRERALVELEQRVEERTAELASRNAELKVSEDRLRDADRRKDEFLATLAHELRNPLAPIRTSVAVLKSDHVTEGERGEARVIIDRQVAQMGRLIDDLLDVSRITAGKLPMRRSQLQLAELLKLAIGTVQPHLDKARHRLTLSLPRQPVVIDGDGARLAQVFANLLHNACKYTEPAGEIAVSASLPNDVEVCIAVRDNGIGIPEEFLPRLFEKFSQFSPSMARSQGGLGLGLSLVQGIVAAHGGRVEARSAGLGRGSEFSVYLPAIVARDAHGRNQHAEQTGGDRVTRKVMVVDDNSDSAEAMAMLLRLHGHLVETAHDGEAALEIAERFQPDAMLLDLGMPKLDGFAVCQRVRQAPWGASVLLVAQTGWGQAQDRARAFEAGFDAHLTKPIDPDAVQEMLANFKPV
jgi:signal transduction histidine kinase/CheY-like chemotaxis protein